jgi:hypothetical protein
MSAPTLPMYALSSAGVGVCSRLTASSYAFSIASVAGTLT